MKKHKKIITLIFVIVSALATASAAGYTLNNETCSWESAGDIVRGTALALQKDGSNFESDCFLNADSVVEDVEGLVYSVYDLFTYYLAESAEDLPPHLQNLIYPPSPFAPVQWYFSL